MAAIDDVLAEREKQRQKWGDDHDDDCGELATAAAFLADPEYVEDVDAESVQHDEWWVRLRQRHRADRRQQMVIAAALAIAEIERLDRAEASRG